MVYFVFDLDSTLADISPVYFYLELLKRLESISQSMGKVAYKHFVDVILERESDLRNPLYILRPRILDICTEIYGLKQRSRCEGVVIYSNNGYLPCLEFVRDLIEQFLGAQNFICNCVYLRDKDRKDTPKKTWRDLKNILVDRCEADPSLGPESVVFFDDLPDHDLRKQLPPENYIHVEPYNYTRTDESLDYIKSTFMEAIKACGIIDQPVLFSNYIKSVRSLYKMSENTTKTNTLKSVFSLIDADAKKIPERMSKPVLNDAILMEVMNRYYNLPMNLPMTPTTPLLPPQPVTELDMTSYVGGSCRFPCYSKNKSRSKKKQHKTLRKKRYEQKTRTYNRRI